MGRGDATIVNTYFPISGAPAAAALERRAAASFAAASAATCFANPATNVQSVGAAGPASEARAGNYGGLNPEAVAAVFYDPRTTTMRAPASLAASMGLPPRPDEDAVSGVPGLAHGPAAFIAYDGPPRVKTQFAPHGPIPLPEPMVLYPAPTPCRCTMCLGVGPGGGPYPYSMAALLLMPANALAVRDALEAQGVVAVSPALRALKRRQLRCASAVLGGGDLYVGFATFAASFETTPLITTPNPGAKVLQLNAAYVEQTLAGIRAQVISAARVNYLRAEGGRAYLQPLPALAGDDDGAALMPPLPAVLPSGVRTSVHDGPYASYALTVPMVAPHIRAAFECQTGLRTTPRC
jgi:hypothetical protein